MKNPITLVTYLVKKHKEIRYLISGGLSEMLEIVSFVILLHFTDWLYFSNSLSFMLGVVSGFILHKLFSFPCEHQFQTKHQLVGFVCLAIFNFFMINLIVGFLVKGLDVLPIIAKFLGILTTISWSYVLVNRVIFKHQS